MFFKCKSSVYTKFYHHRAEDDRAVCCILIVFWIPYGSYYIMPFPHGAINSSTVYACEIF